MQETYKYNIDEFNENGFHKLSGEFFLDLLKSWEQNFNEKFNPLKANYLFSNHKTMNLLYNCFYAESDEIFGMELLNDEIDLDTNLQIEEFSKNKTTYAIESGLDKDEPLFLIKTENFSDGIIVLKYISDNDEVSETINPKIFDFQTV